MKHTFLLTSAAALMLLAPAILRAQQPPATALQNVRIHLSNGTTMESATILWRDGIIEGAGQDVAIPFDAFTIDGGDSLHVYPGFIDGLGMWGAPDALSFSEPVANPGEPGFERAGIQPERQAKDFLDDSDDSLEEIMKAGITTAAIGLNGYMLPGRPGIFFLNREETSAHLFKENIGFQFAFEGAPGGWGSRAYPSTTMGVMARFRQLLYDAEALKDHIDYFASSGGAIAVPKREEVLESLFPLLENGAVLFAAMDSPEDIERLLVLKDEFGFDVVIVSGKAASFIADELSEREIPVLASVELPEKPKWMEDEDDSGPESDEEEHYRERQQQAYEAAALNIRNLIDAGVTVGFASNGLDADDFRKNLLSLHEEGNLSGQDLLQVLTTNTASILNSGSGTGTIQQGGIASFSVFSAPFLEEDAAVKMIISNGEIHEF